MSVPSTIRCSRSQVVSGTRRMPVSGTSAKSRTTAVQTPDCRTRLSAFSDRSIVRSSSVPGPSTARAPGSHAGSTAAGRFGDRLPTHPQQPRELDAARRRHCAGSNRSKVSISATDSPRVVAAPSHVHARLVRPDDAGPISSETCPRGNPPSNRASSAGQPETRRPSSVPSPAGSVVVSVRSSLRSRSRAFDAALRRGAGWKVSGA